MSEQKLHPETLALHAGWNGDPATDALTLVGAYAYTGDKDKFYRRGSTKDLGVGGGFVLSLRYQF